MINSIILKQLKDKKDIATYLTILYGISNGCNMKLFRDCKKEFAELKELMLIETNRDKVTLTVPFYENEMLKIKSKSKNELDVAAIKQIKNEKVEDWISEYRELFPVKSITGLSYHVTGDLVECVKRMKKFIQDYGYTKDIILKATNNYISEQKNKGWSYTKKAHKFIKDLDGSMLSEYCESVKRGDNNKPTTQFNVV